MNVLIIEDNLSFAMELEMHLQTWGMENVVIIDNSEEALLHLKNSETDLILMDINIKGSLNGVEIGQLLNNQDIPIIYMTGQKDEDFYEAAKNTNAISYLVKPFDEMTLRGTIEFAVKKAQNSKDKKPQKQAEFFYTRKRNKLQQIKVESIDWVKSDLNYCYIHYENKKMAVKMPLKKVMEYLPPEDFLMIHRSYIVRLEAIKSIELSNKRVLVDEEYLPIGRKYHNELKERLNFL